MYICFANLINSYPNIQCEEGAGVIGGQTTPIYTRSCEGILDYNLSSTGYIFKMVKDSLYGFRIRPAV